MCFVFFVQGGNETVAEGWRTHSADSIAGLCSHVLCCSLIFGKRQLGTLPFVSAVSRQWAIASGSLQPLLRRFTDTPPETAKPVISHNAVSHSLFPKTICGHLSENPTCRPRNRMLFGPGEWNFQRFIELYCAASSAIMTICSAPQKRMVSERSRC